VSEKRAQRVRPKQPRLLQRGEGGAAHRARQVRSLPRLVGRGPARRAAAGGGQGGPASCGRLPRPAPGGCFGRRRHGSGAAGGFRRSGGTWGGGGWALGKDGAERKDTAGRRKGFVTAGNGEATQGAREAARWFLQTGGVGAGLGGRTRRSRSASRVRPQSSAFTPPCSITCRVRTHDAVTSGPRRGHVRAATRSRPGRGDAAPGAGTGDLEPAVPRPRREAPQQPHPLRRARRASAAPPAVQGRARRAPRPVQVRLVRKEGRDVSV